MEVLIDHPEVKREFEWWMKEFDGEDHYISDTTIGIGDILRAHFLIADHFYSQGYGIANVGPRNKDLLHSCVYRQFVSFDGKDKWQSPFDRCATLVFGIIKDHPFHDANKRTALLVLLHFLYKMNWIPQVKQKELERLVLRVAENNLQKYSRFEEFSDMDDSEIRFISSHIKRCSRRMDKRNYIITYKQLNALLGRHGYCLSNPHNNFIDICKMIIKKRIFGKEHIEYKRVGQIAFPGWTRQVSKDVISKVRKATGLIPERGVDSKAFFHGADPLPALIAEYHGPLQRLANR